MTGYAGSKRDEASLLAWSTWARFDPEFARRLKMLMDAGIDAGHAIGVGGGWRSSEGQYSLFLSRYHPEDDSNPVGDTYWPHTLSSVEAAKFGLPVGKRVDYWEKNPGVAAAAPPGRSYHESTTREGRCLAADMIGDMNWMTSHAAAYGLVHFANAGEPWHLQPIEIPHGRKNYSSTLYEPLKVWGNSSTPLPPPPKPPTPVVIVPEPTIRLRTPYQSGKNVSTLQQIMKFWGWYTATVDGWAGPKTVEAIKRMQTALRITVDGIYGPQTAAAYKKFADAMAAANSTLPPSV